MTYRTGLYTTSIERSDLYRYLLFDSCLENDLSHTFDECFSK